MSPSYQKQLAYYLRMRRVEEPAIADILAEVDSHGAASEEELKAAFGDPQAYADKVSEDAPTSSRRARGFTTVLGIAAVVWMVGVVLLVAVTDFEPPVRFGPFLLWPALGLMVLGLILDVTVTAMKRPPVRE